MRATDCDNSSHEDGVDVAKSHVEDAKYGLHTQGSRVGTEIAEQLGGGNVVPIHGSSSVVVDLEDSGIVGKHGTVGCREGSAGVVHD